jgi:hypothetical protein
MLPSKLPETDDLKLKHLYAWLNQLRDEVIANTPRPSSGQRMTRNAAGFTIHPPPKQIPDDTLIRTVILLMLPPAGGIPINHLDNSGNIIDSFFWQGVIGVGPIPGYYFGDQYDWTNGDTAFPSKYSSENEWPMSSSWSSTIDPSNYAVGFDAAPQAAFYLISLPPTIRYKIIGDTYSKTYLDAARMPIWEIGSDSKFPDVPGNGPNAPGIGIPLDYDYTAVVDPPYFPRATLYIFRPNNLTPIGEKYQFTDPDLSADPIDLSVGWVDMNVDGRRWMPAGLVEGHMRIVLNVGPDTAVTGSRGGVILDSTGHPVTNPLLSIPIIQDSNYAPIPLAGEKVPQPFPT